MMGLSLSNKWYDRVRFVVEKLLPAFAALYSALAVLWGFGYVAQVVGTSSALAIFLGVLLGLSRKNYTPKVDSYDGALVIDENDPNKDTFTLHVDVPLTEIKDKKSLVLQVRNSS